MLEIYIAFMATGKTDRCFFEVGDVAAPPVQLPVVAIAPTLVAGAAPGALPGGSEGVELSEAKERSSLEAQMVRDLAQIAELVNRVGIDPGFVNGVFQSVASVTWATFGVVCRTAGLDWNTFRTWLGSDSTLQVRLESQFLSRTEGGGKLLDKLVNWVLTKLLNLQWPRRSLPPSPVGWDRALGYVNNLGTQELANFGNVGHILGWLDWISQPPDVVPFSFVQASGNLSATCVVTFPTGGEIGFNAFELFSRADWLTMLKANDTAYVLEILNEVNLFVRALSLAARAAAAVRAHDTVERLTD